MKQKLFYQETLGRSNVLKTAVYSFFFSITSYPRLFLEIWIRKNFGTGYFSMAAAVKIVCVLLVVPYLISTKSYSFEWLSFLKQYTTWYIYTAAFAYRSWQHYKDIRLAPGEFDFNKFSKYCGDKDLRFYKLGDYGLNVNTRLISTFYEPLLFFFIGLFLIILGQPIGYLILVSSIIYSLGYSGAFHLGDIYLQNMIDSMIVSKELSDTIMEGKYPRDDRGFEHFEMPKNPDHLRQMASYATDQGEFSDVR